jgi:hypothetical protein
VSRLSLNPGNNRNSVRGQNCRSFDKCFVIGETDKIASGQIIYSWPLLLDDNLSEGRYTKQKYESLCVLDCFFALPPGQF